MHSRRTLLKIGALGGSIALASSWIFSEDLTYIYQLWNVPLLRQTAFDFRNGNLPAGVVIKDAGKKGWGLFSTRNVAFGEEVYRYMYTQSPTTQEVTLTSDLGTKQVNLFSHGVEIPGGHYVFSGFDCLLNHACQANSRYSKSIRADGSSSLYAIAPIEAGDEITVDYDTFALTTNPMTCVCGAPNCRAIVQGYRFLAAEDKDRLRPHVLFPKLLTYLV